MMRRPVCIVFFILFPRRLRKDRFGCGELGFVSKLNDSVHTRDVSFVSEALFEAIINTKIFPCEEATQIYRLVILF